MSPWLFNIYMDASMKEVKIGMGRRGESVEYLTSYMQMTWFCGELEEDLRAMVGNFVEVCRRRGLKVNAGKGKMILLDGEEGLE